MRFEFVLSAFVCALAACSSTKSSAPRPESQPALPVSEAPVVEAQPDDAKAQWKPPAPNEDADDWIRLTSGEWLRGEIEVLRQDTLEFDSEELDMLKLDWSDVAEVRTTRLMTLGLTNRRVVTGTLQIKGDEVAVGADTIHRFKRKELLSIIGGLPTEANYWSGKINFGVTARRGNTNQSDMSSGMSILRRTPDSRIGVNYNGAFTRVEDVETSNTHRLDGKWDRFLSQRFYVTPLFFEAFQDRFQNVDLRFTPGVGAGYHIFDRAGFEWDVDGGLGYQLLRYDSVEAGEPTEQTSATVLFGTTFDTDLTEKVEFDLNYSIHVATESEVGTDHHAKATLSVDLIGELDLDVTVIWDHIGKPVADEEGITPKNDDVRMQIGFAWDF